MIEIILKNLAYTFYPVGICAMNNRDLYVDSFEFKNLIDKVNSSFAVIHKERLDSQILDKLKENEILKDFENLTLESSDRCLSYKIDFIEENVLYQLCINISLLVPYYYAYTLKNIIELEPYRWTTLPERDLQAETGKFQSHLAIISNILGEMNFNKFPDRLVTEIIPNINYADVDMGNFTYFNAFFLDDVNL
ncbi:hypothetical protein [Flavobacterium geliluteum]|uniref:Uncharacterized protein n=1 Tax=Flavobacterium geliluteum TaxID=2816120 RepID=A0A940X6N4_9FLAO|nr:hypothetical protein [Flavobacterium geliluteum]MBP4139143.1 hypothetical protein [Flavobacterium geliluteum]